MKSRRALLAWEIGGGRGHIAKLRLGATSLQRLGFTCTAAALSYLDNARDIAGAVERIRQGPVLPYLEPLRAVRGLPPAASNSDWLADHGFNDTQTISRQLHAWLDIFEEEQPDLVVGDNAPVALLAARSAGIVCAAFGNGFTLPPSNLTEYPAYRGRQLPPSYPERPMLDAINAALAEVGTLELTYLPQVYGSDAPLVLTPVLFDPYAGARHVPVLPPNVPRVGMADGTGDELFVYLSYTERFDPVLLTAIMTIRLPRRVFAPGMDAGVAGVMRERGIVVEDAPVPPADIVRRSRIALHAGNHGIASMCLRAGLPFVAVPQQIEQTYNAQQAQAGGFARSLSKQEMTCPNVHAAIMELYESAAARDAAHAMAERTAGEFVDDPAVPIAERIAALFN